MRYIAILLIVIIFAILALALYGWYRHLKDDEKKMIYVETHLATAC